MLDGLLGRGFAAKCKPLIKLTKSRIEVTRRKRRATEKFLKKDIADLLFNGLDINAYGRAEGLLVELTLSCCYGFVEKCCELVLKHLSVMQKLSGCPEECRVAVSSLMFAAARFSDLPELRDLRKIFQERYGNSLDCYANQEFAANLNFESPALEKKVCLLQEIASECSINWDGRAFKLRMSSSSASAQGQSASMYNQLSDYDKPQLDKGFTQKDVDNAILLEKNPEHANDGCNFQNGKEAVILNRDDQDLLSKFTVSGIGFKQLNGCEVLGNEDGDDNSSNPLMGSQEATAKKSDRSYWKENNMIKPNGRLPQDKTLEKLEGGYKLHNSWGNMTPPKENQDMSTARKSPSGIGSRFRSNVKEPFTVNLVGPPNTDKSLKKIQNDENEMPMLKPCYSKVIRSPYVKPNSKQQNSIHGFNSVSSHIDSDGFFTCPSAHDMSEQIGFDNSDQDWQAGRHERLGKQSCEKEFSFCENAKEIPMVKPKPIRRKHSRSRSSHNDAPNVETVLVRKTRSKSRRRDESRRGLRNLFNEEQYENAKEERIIDKLLIHYSKKPPILVPEKLRKKSINHHALQIDNSTLELQQNGSIEGSDDTPEKVTFAPRSISLPREQHRVEVKKEFERAASFQHVHPKLPDYDDLAARFAALRGR